MKKINALLVMFAAFYVLPVYADPVQAGKAKRDLPGIAETINVTAKLKVEKVDKESRMVTLKREDGTSVEVKAGPEVRNFAQIAVGDTVNVEYKKGSSVSVEPKSVGAKIDALATEARAALGEKPAADVGVQAEFRTVVDDINYEKREVTLKGPTGNKETFIVSKDVKRFANVKKGDEVVVRMTESVSISVNNG